MHVTSCISSTLVILNSVFKRWMDFFPVRSSLFLGLYASVYSCLISSIADQSVYPPKNNIHKILEKLYRNTKIWWSLSKISFTLHSWPSFRRRGGVYWFTFVCQSICLSATIFWRIFLGNYYSQHAWNFKGMPYDGIHFLVNSMSTTIFK